jgi:hypothetical protein
VGEEDGGKVWKLREGILEARGEGTPSTGGKTLKDKGGKKNMEEGGV